MSRTPLAEQISKRFTHLCVGSLPYKDAATALSFIAAHPHIIPFWPELPGRAPSEMMLPRAERALETDWSGYRQEEAAGLFAVREALEEGPHRPGFMKCQVCGPLTLLLYSDTLHGGFEERMSKALEACSRQIEWQASLIAPFDMQLLFVLDEPGLIKWNGLSEIERVRLGEAYTYLYVKLSESGHYSGLHSCASFGPHLLNLPFELLSFDAGAHDAELFMDPALHSAWRAALKRGLVVAPGTFDSCAQKDPEKAWSRGEELYLQFAAFLSSMGDNGRNCTLRSATCGHAGASPEWLEFLYRDRTNSV